MIFLVAFVSRVFPERPDLSIFMAPRDGLEPPT